MVAFSRQSVHSFLNSAWWEKEAGGQSYVLTKVGFCAVVCESVYLKYMHGVRGMSRTVLWYTLAFLKQYPKQGNFDSLGPRSPHLRCGDSQARPNVLRGIKFLFRHMHEISMCYGEHVPPIIS